MHAESKAQPFISFAVLLILAILFIPTITYSQSNLQIQPDQQTHLQGTQLKITCFGKIQIYKNNILKKEAIGKLTYIPQEPGKYEIKCENEIKIITVNSLFQKQNNQLNQSNTTQPLQSTNQTNLTQSKQPTKPQTHQPLFKSQPTKPTNQIKWILKYPNKISTKSINYGPLKPLTGKDFQGRPITETAIGKNFILSSYATNFELVSHHSSPISQRITYRLYNSKPLNYSYILITGNITSLKAWHLINKTITKKITKTKILKGNQTSIYNNSVYIPPYFDQESNSTNGNYTIIHIYQNITYNKTTKIYDTPELILETTNFLEKWNNNEIEIKQLIENYGIRTDLSNILAQEVIPSNNEKVLIYKVSHISHTYEYIQYITPNKPSKFIALDPAGASWWNETWKWRTQINVTNTADNLTDYQIEIVLTSNNFNFSKANDNLSDIRFTYYNATSQNELEIQYFMSSNASLNYSTGDYNATFWIKIPFLQNNTNTTIYMYYGNPNAQSESNSSVCPGGIQNNYCLEWFDDFNADSSANYTLWTNPSWSGSFVWNPSSSRLETDTSNRDFFLTVNNTIYNPPQDHFLVEIRAMTGDDDSIGALIRTTDGNYYAATIRDNDYDGSSNTGQSQESIVQYNGLPSNHYQATQLLLLNDVVNPSSYQVGGIEYDGSNLYAHYNGARQSQSYNVGSLTIHSLGLSTHANSPAAYYDWIRIRRYAYPEPTYQILGEEYVGVINVTIDLPEQNSVKTRLQTFILNGTVNCTRGDCGNVSAKAQYLSVETPTYTWTETTNTDFNSYSEKVNISVLRGSIRLEQITSGDPWWNNTWQYRQEFNITNTGGNLTNYPIKLVINSSIVGPNFNWNSDQNATRFIWFNSFSEENIKLDYYIGSWSSSSQNATFWIKIPFLQNNTNTTIYMYYGNPNAQSESNSSVCPGGIQNNYCLEWFDDFNADSSANYTLWTNPSWSGSFVWNPSSSRLETDTSNRDFFLTVNNTIYNPPQDHFLVEIRAMTGDNDAIGALIRTTDGNYYIATLRVSDYDGSSNTGQSQESIVQYNGLPSGWYQATQLLLLNDVVNPSSYQVGGIEYDGSNLYAHYNGARQSQSYNVGSLTIHSLGLSTHANSPAAYYDWIRIRRYAYPEPTVITHGSEQILSIKTSGYYISSSFDTGSANVQYQKIYWYSSENENTTIEVYTRTSADNSTWGFWFSQTNNSQIWAENKRYIQYKVVMNSTNSKQTPVLDNLTIEYKIATPSWTNMDSSTSLATTNNPLSCGYLNKTTEPCYPSWQINPKQVGKYSVRIYAGSPVNGTSEVRNITVMANTYVTNFTSNQSLVARTKSVLLTARLLDDTGQPMEGYNLTFWNTNFTSVYNFNTYPSVIIPGQKAYESTNAGGVPPSTGPEIPNEVEFSSTKYGAINSSDNNYATTNSGDERTHRFSFNITENINHIRKISFYWEGKHDTSTTVYLMIWNYTGSTWDLLTQENNVDNTNDTIITYDLTSGFFDYINQSGILNIMIEVPDPGFNPQTLYTDYVYINVTNDYYIGTNTTNSNGYASVIYIVPNYAYLGNNILKAEFNGSSEEFLNPSYDTTTIKVSSIPQIKNISATPQTVGYGFNVAIRANVTDEVGIDKVFVNITKPSGDSIFVEMTNIYGSIYEYNFSDTWTKGTYTYFIWTNNTDGISNQSQSEEFYVNATLDIGVGVEKENYKANEYVYSSNCRADWWNCSWFYRKEITFSSEETVYNYPVNLTLDTASLISQGKLNSNCSDLRFVYEKPIHELPITIDNSGYNERINETVKLTITDTSILNIVESENEIRLFNSSVEEPYENSNYLPFWIESLSSEELTIWAKVPYIPADGQKTIYMYYGNPSADNVEDYNATFDEIIGEAGSFATDHNWYSVNFASSYSTTPVVVTSMTTNQEGDSGAATAAVSRIKNLDMYGFEARAEEYPSGDGLHATENFSYIAIKPGTWIVAGLLLEAGTGTTTSSYSSFPFSANFGSTPAVISQINSYNELDSGSHTRMNNPTSTGINIKIEEETDTSHTSETIGYLAIKQGGANDIIETYRTVSSFDEVWDTFTFSKYFSSTPAMVGKIMTENGGDNSEERIRNLDSQGFQAHLEETPSYDGDHINEDFSYIAVKEGLIRGIQYKPQPSISLGTPTQIGTTYKELPYWIEGKCNSFDTLVWTQIPFIPANGQATIQFYYGNPAATSNSDEISAFTYRTQSNSYVVLGIQGANLDIVSYSDNNKITLGSTTTTLNEQQTYTVSAGDVTLGSLLKSTGPVSSGTQSSGDGAPLTPITFKGRLFEIPVSRYNPIYLDFYALEDTAITVYNSTGSGWTSVETFNLTQGSAISKSYTGTDTDIDVEISYLVNSTADVIVFFRGNAEDYMPLVPAGKEFYIEPSNYLQMGAVYDNTQVTVYYSGGTSTSFTLNAGQAWTSSSLGADGSADPARVIANNSVFAYQEADSDGTEVTPALPPELMDYIFVFPQDAEYFVATTLTNKTTNCTLYNTTGGIENSWQVTANYPYPGKISLGTGQDGTTYIYSGWKLVCDNPVTVYYEYATNDAETLLYGPKAHQKFGVNLSYSVSNIEETKEVKLKNYGNTSVKGYLWMLVQKKTNTGWQNIIPPVLDDRPDNIRILNPGDEINLTQLWNSNPWYTDRKEPGKYRAYVAFVDPNGNVLVSAIYGNVENWDEFEIIKAELELTNLEHENQYEHSINEYEVGDKIDWINVTVSAINNTALGANITLNLLDWNKNRISWGPNETKQCGDIPEGQSCERKWDNSSGGYFVPLDASSGTYDFFWNVTMALENGNLNFNDSYNITIHNIPSTFSSILTKQRLYKPDSTMYNFTFNNTWSSSLANVYVKINCPNITGLLCECNYSGQSGDTCYLGNVAADTQVVVPFNISVNDSTPTGNYVVNITINYTNPGNEYHNWEEYESKTIEVRSPDLLEITLHSIPTNYTRGYLYNLSAYANNTAGFTSHNAWLNYTLPIGWVNTSGSLNQYAATLDPSNLLWNNMTVNISYSSSLGQQEIRLDSASDEGQEDWKTKAVYIWADTSLVNLQANDTTPDKGDTITLQARLLYDNGNPVVGESVNFYDENESLYIGSATTNLQGWAIIQYTISNSTSLGNHTINATYNGSSSLYTLPSDTTVQIEIHERPVITDISITPEIIGYGFNVSIRANVTDMDDGIDKVFAKVRFPNGTLYRHHMTNISQNIYEVNLTDLWIYGQYNITIWANDTINSISESSVQHFYLKAEAKVFVRTENNSYTPSTYVNLTDSNNWWNYEWNYRKEINISENSMNNLSEYQLLIVLNETNFNYSKAKENGSDIRFIFYNETSNKNVKLSYYIEKWNTEGESKIWIKIPLITANDNTTIYIYYGNPSATSESNLPSTFSYSKPRTMGYIVSDQIVSNGIRIMSLCDNNNITIGSYSFTLNEQESASIPANSVSINDSVRARCLAQIEGNGDVDDIILPISWAGKEFIYGGMRATDEFCMLSPFGDASVTIYDGASSVWSGTITSSGTCITQDITSGNAARIESDKPILVFHGGNEDAFGMYPATKEKLYGIPSNNLYIAAGSSGATITYTRSDTGATSTQTISANSQYSSGSLGDSGSSPAFVVNGSNPIGTIQQADHDGTESTTFLPAKELTTKFGSSLSAEYISIATPFADTSCTVYDSSGSEVATASASGSNGIYKICFDCGNDNTYLTGGWKVECTNPVFAYYEEDSSGDETNLLGYKQMRQYVYPEPTYSISSSEETPDTGIANPGTDFYGYLLMQVYRNTTSGWQLVDTVINETTARLLEAGENLNISPIWNSNPWNTDKQSAGVYKIYAALTDSKGNILNSEYGSIEDYYLFNITAPSIQLNITEIRIYNVTGNPNAHIYTGDLKDSGINKTFTLYKGQVYRIEIQIDNLPLSQIWYINSSTITHSGLNSTWTIDATDDIWYSNESNRAQTDYTGGWWNGTLKWNSSLDGVVQPGGTATFYYIVNITTNENEIYPVVFTIDDPTFTKTDHSAFKILVPENVPPSLYNNIYNLTKTKVIRGESTTIYARWDETIRNATAEYNSTSSFLENHTISLPEPNPKNWTNHTISTTFAWLLGTHVAKIYAADEQDNWNNTLQYLNFTVWGMAEITDGILEPSTINVTNSTKIKCKVADTTTLDDDPIANYTVYFYNSTGLMGTNTTNSTGWAVFTYIDDTPGQETITCNITKDESCFYEINQNNYKQFTLTTKELIEPWYSNISSNVTCSPPVVHKGDYVELRTLWHDNFQLDTALLKVNATGVWETASSLQLSGTLYWANFTYQIPSSIEPGYLGWRQHANDTFNNQNTTPTQTLEVWGWSEISEAYLTDDYIYVNETTTMKCKVRDANSLQGIANYTVYFYNSTGLMGTNITNSIGWAVFTFNDTSIGDETITCNITDSPTLMYNSTSNNTGSDVLHTAQPGEDITPPSIVDNTYGLNDTSISKWLNEKILAYALWDEAIGNATIEYNSISSTLETYQIQPPYTDNWTNYTIQTNGSWVVGVHYVKIRAADNYDNWNNSLNYLNFTVYGRSGVYWQSPTGNVDRGIIQLKCEVKDIDGNYPLEGYTVKFYNSTDLIGSNVTNSSGIAVLNWNASLQEVGPEQMTCTISSQGYYYATESSDSETITLYGSLNTTITNPLNESIYHKGETVILNSTTKDENGNNITSISAIWYNSTMQQIATGENTNWQIPLNYKTGQDLITLNVTKSYYHSDSDNVSVEIWGWSNISWISPDGGNASQGSVVQLVCQVKDANSSYGIQNYSVNFYYKNSTETNFHYLGSSNTNSTGHATYSWDTSGLPLDNYTTMCNITDSQSTYYNATSANEANTTIELVAPVGILEVHLILPPSIPGKGDAESNAGYKVGQNKTFILKANITCRNGNCGTVQGTVRYNSSGSEPDTAISTTYDTPFYVVNSSNGSAQNSVSCGTLNVNESCVLNWTINSTGTLHSIWALDVLFTGTQAANNDTNNTKIDISIVLIMSLSGYKLNATVEPTWPSSNKVAMNGSPIYVSIHKNSNDAEGIYIKGTNLTGPGNYSLSVENMSYALVNNPVVSTKITSIYDDTGCSSTAGSNCSTYYWISTPHAVASGYYYGFIYIMANATG